MLSIGVAGVGLYVCIETHCVQPEPIFRFDDDVAVLPRPRYSTSLSHPTPEKLKVETHSPTTQASSSHCNNPKNPYSPKALKPNPRNADRTPAAWSPSIGPLERAAEMAEAAASSLAATATWALFDSIQGSQRVSGLLGSFNA